MRVSETVFEYVDLGLPSGTLWASCNVGATKPEECGDYFAWGETKPKDDYCGHNYKWQWLGSDKVTKYCCNEGWGIVDGKRELDFKDDAAFVNWGADWLMPSSFQIKELIDFCTWTWTQLNGVYGQRVVGVNGNFIFLPATFSRHVSDHQEVSSFFYGSYLSRTLSLCDGLCFNLFFNSNSVGEDVSSRLSGYPVRPVRMK
ncbi:MAG: hypothetical protein IKS94_07440 [Prevotella sp.]|nr:hypothetical protein [Prevotella sp.]